MKKLATILAASGLAFGLAGCGSSNEAEKTVENFGQALKDKDFETVCDTIDPELVKTLEESTNGQSCADAMKENEEELTGDIGEDEEINIVDSTIADDEKTATVTVENADEKEEDIKLKKVDDEWKITFE
ncbi:DUF4878 domain-containing protein [Janibacter sp. GS2]|uniref:DUF4878 domain-containing protein n=1 Tax=Janibacter sp. GS2 TaxID=3442646 RepID=UPI003EBCF274